MVAVSELPVIAHLEADISSRQRLACIDLANSLLIEQPRLRLAQALQPLAVRRLADGPTLHLDDLSGIPLLDRYCDVSFLEERARLRAGDGDTVATRLRPDPAFEHYTRERLGLGRVEWLHGASTSQWRGSAYMCWEDPVIRQRLVEQAGRGRLRYIHPHMGSFGVWALALLLKRAAGTTLQVIAPHPALARAVNDKLWFASAVERLLGPSRVPLTRKAYSLSGLSRLLLHLAAHADRLVIKLPDSAGGAGNLRLEARQWRGRGLGETRQRLKQALAPFGWQGERPLLIGSWESEVLCTPSVQAWIPPAGHGDPVIEGLFLQLVYGEEGMFEGSRPAHLPRQLSTRLSNEAARLCLLFQNLGYVGRCSLDTIVCGHELARSQHHFIECNGRWGGTSTPMTLVNRLLGDWTCRPYAAREVLEPGLERLSFPELLAGLDTHLYDARSGRGSLVLYNPGRLRLQGGIDVLALGRDQRQADALVTGQVPRFLRSLLRKTRRSAPPELRPHAPAHPACH